MFFKKILSNKKQKGLLILSFSPFFLLLMLIFTFSFLLESKKTLNPAKILTKISSSERLNLSDFSFSSINDKNTNISGMRLKGRPKLILFWASWCPSCRDEWGILEKIAREKKIDLIGINVKDNFHNARRFLHHYQDFFLYSFFDKKEEFMKKFHILGLPSAFLVDSENYTRYRLDGPINQEIYENCIKPFLENIHFSQKDL